MIVDALGNPLALRLTGGQVDDITQAEALAAEVQPQALLGDKGYDAGSFIENLKVRAIKPVIGVTMVPYTKIPDSPGGSSRARNLQLWPWRAQAPVGRVFRRRLQRPTNDFGDFVVADLAGRSWPGFVLQEVKPHRVRYYLERRDPEFKQKMAEVLCVYREVKLIKETAAAAKHLGRGAFVYIRESTAGQLVHNQAAPVWSYRSRQAARLGYRGGRRSRSRSLGRVPQGRTSRVWARRRRVGDGSFSARPQRPQPAYAERVLWIGRVMILRTPMIACCSA